MRQQLEIRIPEDSARTVLPSDIGTVVGKEVAVRVIRLDLNDPLVKQVAAIDQARMAAGRALITSWSIQRTYERTEIELAQLFLLKPRQFIDCAGEQFGTQYDQAPACPFCGFGRRQMSPLRLSCRCRPRGEISQTLAADELVVSQTFMGVQTPVNGAKFMPIEWAGNCPDLAGWSQLVIVGNRVRVDRTLTRFGESPFEAANTTRTACPLGHVLGLNILSELHCVRESYSGADIALTDIGVGSRAGLLVPAPLVVLSGEYGRQLIKAKIRGADLEVAYLEPPHSQTNAHLRTV